MYHLIVYSENGKRYMRNREAYQLKTFMGFYNLFQVLYCVFLITNVSATCHLTPTPRH